MIHDGDVMKVKKLVKKIIILGLLASIIQPTMHAWNVSDFMSSCKSYVNAKTCAVAAGVVSAVAIATSLLAWKKMKNARAERRAMQEQRDVAQQQRDEFQSHMKEAQEQRDAAKNERDITRAHYDQMQQRALEKSERERQIVECLRLQLRHEREKSAMIERRVLRITERLEAVAQAPQRAREQEESDIARLTHELNQAKKRNERVERFINNYEVLIQQTNERLTVLDELYQDICAQLQNANSLTVLQELQKQQKAILQELQPILYLLDERCLDILDDNYKENFEGTGVLPTQAYAVLGIAKNECYKPEIIQAKRDVCEQAARAQRDQARAQGDEARAQTYENRLSHIRQAGYVFGYPYCNISAASVYSMYRLWCKLGKPEFLHEIFKVKVQTKKLLEKAQDLQVKTMQLGLAFAEREEQMIRCQAIERKKDAEYEHIQHKTLSELQAAFNESVPKIENDVARISQALGRGSFARADLDTLEIHKFELEAMQAGLGTLLRAQQINSTEYNNVFLTISRQINRIERVIRPLDEKFNPEQIPSYAAQARRVLQSTREKATSAVAAVRSAAAAASSAVVSVADRALDLVASQDTQRALAESAFGVVADVVRRVSPHRQSGTPSSQQHSPDNQKQDEA